QVAGGLLVDQRLQDRQQLDLALGQDQELALDNRFGRGVLALEWCYPPLVFQAELQSLFLLGIGEVCLLNSGYPEQPLLLAFAAAEKLDEIGVGLGIGPPGKLGPVGQDGRAVKWTDDLGLGGCLAADNANGPPTALGKVAQTLQVGR